MVVRHPACGDLALGIPSQRCDRGWFLEARHTWGMSTNGEEASLLRIGLGRLGVVRGHKRDASAAAGGWKSWRGSSRRPTSRCAGPHSPFSTRHSPHPTTTTRATNTTRQFDVESALFPQLAAQAFFVGFRQASKCHHLAFQTPKEKEKSTDVGSLTVAQPTQYPYMDARLPGSHSFLNIGTKPSHSQASSRLSHPRYRITLTLPFVFCKACMYSVQNTEVHKTIMPETSSRIPVQPQDGIRPLSGALVHHIFWVESGSIFGVSCDVYQRLN